MNKFSPWPSFDDEQISAVSRVLTSGNVNYWTGEEGKLFEREFALWADSDFGIALSNGTSALEVALRSLDIGSGHEVIVASRTFIASVSSIVMVGATPVFVDVDRDSQNIHVGSIGAAITASTRAIICVHLAGWPCDMPAIMKLAETYGLFVIEDCAQAHGAKIDGKSVGSFGHVGAWSFCQDKIMTTGGEGGAVTTNSRELWSKMWSFKDHGKSWSAVYEKQHPPGFRWLHESFGSNYRMTEMQAAIARIQLRRMAVWSESRIGNASRIWNCASKHEVFRVPEVPSDFRHAAYKAYVFVNIEKLRPGWDRDRIMAEISASGVPCFSGSCSEVYLEKAFDETDYRPADRLPVAKELGETSLMFLVHPTLTEQELDEMCLVIDQVADSCAIPE